jgi:hypothetical protein
MKGVSLGITMIVLLALAVAVISFSIHYFISQKNNLNRLEMQKYLMDCCQKWLYDDCNPADVAQTGSSLPGCKDFYSVAQKYGINDIDNLRDFCNCPQGG